jgi:hypothetical protein
MAFSPDRHTLLMVMAGTSLGIPPMDGRLSRGDLPGPGLQDLAHDHVVHLIRFDARPLQGGPDGVAPEGDPADVAEAPPNFPIGRSSAVDDH